MPSLLLVKLLPPWGQDAVGCASARVPRTSPASGAWAPSGTSWGDAQFAEFREAGAVAEDIVTAAEDVLYVERMKTLLLDRP
jgi:hypothetical protein